MITSEEFLNNTQRYVDKDTPYVTAESSGQYSENKFDVGAFLKDHGRSYTVKQKGTATLYCIECPFDQGHGKDAAIIKTQSGALVFKCFHDSCKGNTWAKAKKTISGDDPDDAPAENKQENCRHAGGKIDQLQTAHEIIASFGWEDIVYVNSLRIFRRWNGHVWTKFDDRTIGQKAIAHLRDRSDKVTKNVLDSITDMIRTLLHRGDVIWDEDTGVIPVLNGELKWTDGQWILQPHTRGNYRTTLIPVPYDPEASAPGFEQFLEEVFLGDDDAADKTTLIYEAIGYTLTTSCAYEKFILLIGQGANGKSVLLAVLRLLVGPKQVAAVQPEQMDNQFQRAHLCGKLANIVTEIKEGGEIADAALKAITSGESMTAEHKFKDPFDFQPFSTCWLGTNHMPHTRDFSDALFRRALIVEFNRVFQEHEQDKHLKDKLAAELPGILRLALNAFGGVIQRGTFTMPQSCVRAREQWRIEADQVRQFLAEQCVMEPGARVLSGSLFKAYQSWAENAGVRTTLNRGNFSKRVKRMGVENRRTASARYFDGIRFKEVSELEYVSETEAA